MVVRETCVSQLQDQGPFRTCSERENNEAKEEVYEKSGNRRAELRRAPMSGSLNACKVRVATYGVTRESL
jgi:hypothetical protein